MKKTFLGLIALLGLSVSAFASATIISGTSQNVTFDSKPAGATVMIDGVKTCTTPCTVSVPKGFSDKSLSMSKEGFETYTVPMTTHYDGVALINVFWDLSTTDAVTGAAWKYSPNSYFFELKPESK